MRQVISRASQGRPAVADPVKTTCPYCGTGCGVLATNTADGVEIAADPDHPANFGRLCSKGAALGETLGAETRLLYPAINGSRVEWPTAIETIATKIAETIATHGPDSFAFYLSGQLLTEDYYVANKLAKGFIGTANVDTNSRLCMASTVAGHRRAFGTDTVPASYEDIEEADLVVLTGSNLAWCHPVLFQRLRAARERRGTKVVVIDPRRTDTCDITDLHLALKPGTDVALFNGLLSYLSDIGALDDDFLRDHVSGSVDQSLAIDDVAAICDLDLDQLQLFFDLFAETPKTVTIFSQGVNQSSAGTDKVNAILNVHLATGRIGKPGAAPFSVTGQPNAMGGREVGGLANTLAAHMGFDAASVDRVRRFWQAPRMATSEGLKAVDLFRAVADGKIKVLWILGTNPAVSLPEAGLVRQALAKCPTVIVSDCVATTDTIGFADILLPALPWSEKDGTVTNSDRTISRQRAFRPAMGEARADWWVIAQVASALGHASQFAWSSAADIFFEHARLSAFENNGSRDLDLSGFLGLDYDTMSPTQWGKRRFFEDGRFFTPDGRARMVPVTYRPPRRPSTPIFPLVLNTGRYRDQWHTMTRTGLSPRLSGHRPEPLLEIHPLDARRFHLTDGGLARIASSAGRITARVATTDAQRRGEVFLPMHWTDAWSADSVIGRLIPAEIDPVSGQPESKHVPVSVEAITPIWSGLLISEKTTAIPDDLVWWTRRTAEGAVITELAGNETPDRLIAALDQNEGAGRIELIDRARGIARYAWMDGKRLRAVLFIAPERPQPATDWIVARLNGSASDPLDPITILAGVTPAGTRSKGAIICACHSVGLTTLTTAIATHKLTSVDAIGRALKAGTGCGSCIPELKRLLTEKEPIDELQSV